MKSKLSGKILSTNDEWLKAIAKAMSKEPGTLLDFLKDEFGDPLRTARGIIYGCLVGLAIWLIAFGMMSG